jgi:hypothetical protein
MLDVLAGLAALALIIGVLWVLWGVVTFVYQSGALLWTRHRPRRRERVSGGSKRLRVRV